MRSLLACMTESEVVFMPRHQGKSRLRRAAGCVLSLFVALSYFSPAQEALRSLPPVLSLTAGDRHTLLIGSPLTLTPVEGPIAVSASDDETLRGRGAVSVTAETSGTAEMLLSLMGLIPIRTVEVEIGEEKILIPGGQALGVAMRTEGVLVVGTGEMADGASPAKLCGIQPGDIIRRVNGVSIGSASQLSDLIAKAGEKPLPVEYTRGGSTMTATLTPRIDPATGTARMGAWVRDSTAGVGTMSFYDPETGRFGALGHAITDGDTGQILTVSRGEVLHADVVAVQKGEPGRPGELKGSFMNADGRLGAVTLNSALGVYGTLDAPPTHPLYPDGLPVGRASTVHPGPATILSTVDGGGIQVYDIEIERVNPASSSAQKSMLIRVTDEALIEKTGGIVQGMSGSPIIQDGRIIGAVTHVLVNDPTRGYGIFIENMLGTAETAS